MKKKIYKFFKTLIENPIIAPLVFLLLGIVGIGAVLYIGWQTIIGLMGLLGAIKLLFQLWF